MRCPSCGTENYSGEDTCQNCGADLWSESAPPEHAAFKGATLGDLAAVAGAAPATVEPTESAERAVARMQEAELDALLVVADGRLVGIFTERDALLKLSDKRLDSFDVRDVMTRDPVVLRVGDTIAVAIHKMAVGGFRHIPVLDGDRPVALIAARDVFRHVTTIGA
jgi:CBS domain-containing protein